LIALCCTVLTALAGRGGFYYKNFQFDAVVHSNNMWEVTETYEVNYLEPRHGIYRTLPFDYFLDQKVKDVFGNQHSKRLEYTCDIDYISLKGGDISTDYDGSHAKFRIGDPDVTVTGLHTYVLKYNVEYPYDRNPDMDFIFHSVLGPDFEAEIKHFSFHVTFDKPLTDYAKGELKVYSGSFGDRGNALDVKVHQTANTLSGEIDNIPSYQGITLYQQLSEGYYEGFTPHSPMPVFICLAITLLIVITLVIKLLFKKQPVVTKHIEFYPPEGMSSAEVGTLQDEAVNDIDIASLIPWFASQGYLTIRECDNDGKIDDDTQLEITRVKALPDDAPDYQHTFFNLLFANGLDTVRLKDIAEQPKEMEKVRKQLNGYFSKSADGVDRSLYNFDLASFLFAPLIAVTSLAFILSFPGAYFSFWLIVTVVCAWTIPFFIGLVFVDSDHAEKYFSDKSMRVFFFFVRLVGFAIATGILGYKIFEQDSFLTPAIFGAVTLTCFVLTELSGRLITPTPYRVKMIEHLAGLKEFIETAEKPRLESLLADDPQYFYRLLPFALVFGISDRWVAQFKDIMMECPSWYDGSADFTSFSFTDTMISRLTTTTTDAITTISHDSSSVSSDYDGGGFSGGGGGGGGGGSW